MVWGPVLAYFPYSNQGQCELDLYRKKGQNWSQNHEFSLKIFSRTCTAHFVGKKCYFCIAKSSGVQKNTTFFDEVAWTKKSSQKRRDQQGRAPNLARWHISSHISKSPVHRVPPPLCTWVFTIPLDTFCRFSVLWYTFRGPKKLFTFAQPPLILTEAPARHQQRKTKSNK